MGMDANIDDAALEPDDADEVQGALLSQTVARYLLAQIASGQMRRGQYIRTKAVSAALNCSHTPVREALLQLQGEGLVRLIPRRGFLVAGFDEAYIADTFCAEAMIGGEIAARAAQNISPAELRKLEDIQAGFERAVDSNDGELAAKRASEFSRSLKRATNSPRLVFLLDGLSQRLPVSCRIAGNGDLKSEAALQRQVLRALKDRAPDAARAAMSDLVVAGGKQVLAALGRTGQWRTEAGA